MPHACGARAPRKTSLTLTLPSSRISKKLTSFYNNTTNSQYAAPHYVFYNNLTTANFIRRNTYALSVNYTPAGGCGYGI